MREHIILKVFFTTFLVCFITGIISFTHENDLFDSLSLLLGALGNFLSWFTLFRLKHSGKNALTRFATERRIAVFYIMMAILFLILMAVSIYYTPEILTPATLFLCAMTQIIAYKAFLKQQRESARGEA